MSELQKALKQDFARLYVRQFTSDYEAKRFIRNLEIDVMQLDAIQSLIAFEVRKARRDELIWSTGVEYKYDRDRKMIQDRIAELEAE